MIRLIVFLVIVLALGFGFSWIADNPGVVTLNWQGKDIRTSLMVVVVALVTLVAVIL
ncbi:MAG: heme biosynthesis protein HemY, partial [Gammaproteobacteria bacterium]|nr:heme biosynthesis protein HemY [Gammaproteobacteria bacterium]